MSEWQPISTAPKDGTHFLGYTPEDRYASSKIKETWMGKYTEGSIGYQRWLDGECAKNIGWQYIERDCVFSWKPTHWMPIPKPPSEAT